MRTFFTIGTALALVLFSQLQLLADVTLVGSSTIHPIIKDAVKIFHQQTGIKVETRGGGSSAGIEAALDGTADIGMVSRELMDDEKEKLTSHTIGTDGIAVIVNSANAISSINDDEVIKVFSGRITNWKVLGGPDKKITLVAKEQGRSTKKLFESHFSLEGKVSSSARLIGSNTEDIMFVAADPYAIGYVSIGSAETAYKQGVFIKPLALKGIEATTNNVANSRYPLRRQLNLVTKGSPQGESKHFIDFILSPPGQILVRKAGFIQIQK